MNNQELTTEERQALMEYIDGYFSLRQQGNVVIGNDKKDAVYRAALATLTAEPFQVPDAVTQEDVHWWILKQTDHNDGPKCRIEHAAYIGAKMWNACRAEVLKLNAVPPVQGSEELSRLRDWVKCVEAERDKAIAWHSSLLKKYEQLKAALDASTVGYIRANEVALLQRLNTHSCVEVAIYNTQAFRDDAAVFVRNAGCQVGSEVAEVARAALDYIDALPSEVVAALPAMPGFDRDWAEGVLKNETD